MSAFPPIHRQLFNFVKAVARHGVDGWRNVDKATFDARTAICSTCEHRIRSRCSKCGCFISEKALWASEECPEKKWQQQAQS